MAVFHRKVLSLLCSCPVPSHLERFVFISYKDRPASAPQFVKTYKYSFFTNFVLHFLNFYAIIIFIITFDMEKGRRKMGAEIIRLESVHKSFGENEIVKGIDLDVMPGEFLTLLGPSGCGKTTTLRMIAGFEALSSGRIFIDGSDVSGVAPYNRPVNTVFQNYALFPLMNVYDNVAYGLTIKKLPKAEIREKVSEALKTVQLEGFEKRKIKQLSGGQKQRVAIARALVNNPKVLLLDEPLGALDFKLRKQMQLELKRLQKQLNITFIYVTHDQEEAMTMSDRIAVMHGGKIEQLDTPANIYNAPKTRFVADFVGESNLLEASIAPDAGGSPLFTTACGAAGPVPQTVNGETVFLCIRPEAMQAAAAPVEGFGIVGRVIDNICTGNMIKTLVRVGGDMELKLSRLAGTEAFPLGSTVYLHWAPDACTVMEK